MKLKKFFISLVVFSILAVPMVSFAVNKPDVTNGIVKCGRATIVTYYDSTGKNTDKDGKAYTSLPTGGRQETTIDPKDMCGFSDLIDLIDRIITYVLFYFTIPIVAIMFVYAGGLLIFSGGSSASRSKAKSIFFSAAIGLVLAFASYLIIKLVFSLLGYSGADWIGF